MLNKEKSDYLAAIYFDPRNPASFSGLEKIWRLIKKDKKVSRQELKEWLLAQDTYTSYYPVRRKFRRPKTISPYPNAIWGSDVAYMVAFSKNNDSYSYFTVFIDLFSLYAYAAPLKTLRGIEMVTVLKAIFERAKPEKLFTDSGSEYKNRWVEKYLKSENVHHYTSNNETKVAHAERLIKTIKRKLLQYMNEKNSYEWYTILDDVIFAYNNSVSRSHGMTPTQAQQDQNRYQVWANRYFTHPRKHKRTKQSKPKTINPFKFKDGDRVKVLNAKRVFGREYDEQYSTETFTVTDRRIRDGIPSYTIKDELNEPITGEFIIGIINQTKRFKFKAHFLGYNEDLLPLTFQLS